MSTIKQYIADGTNALFQIPFPYLDQNHVGVSLNGFPMNLGAHFEYIPGGGAIRFRPHVTPVQNVLVEIKRETPIRELLVKFQNGATLTQEDLNTASLQSLYSIEELWDRYETRFGEAAIRLSNGSFTNAQNLIDAAVASVLDSQLLADLQGRISDIDANAEAIIGQTLRLDDVDARIVTVETVINNEVEQLAQTIAILGAANGDNTAFVLDLAKVRTDETTTLGQRLDAIDVEIGESNAAIVSEQNARIDADGALASDISGLTTTVAGNTASISTQQVVLNGLAAQWMVKTDVNGHVAGFGLYNNGATSQFIVSASTFGVSNGPTVKVPFVVTGGVCYMQNVVIQDALIENLTVGKLTSGILTASITQNADINVGTGRIIWSNGAYMKVAGVGFGTAGQFIEWFGPTMAVSSCSESNAIYYLKTNGSSYFGGTLSAGTLKTSGQTTDTTATANITIGPFGTNGNPINVVLSYNSSKNSILAGSAFSNATYPCSASINLYRTIGTGGEALVATLNVTGSCVHDPYEPVVGSHDYRQSLSGSVTYTDNAGGTGNRTYRATLSSRSVHHGDAAQNISIVATE